MSETPDETIARLQAELARAELARAQLARAQLARGESADANPGVNPAVSVRKDYAAAEGFLAPAPRPVPFAYRAVAISFSFWLLFALFMLAVAPIGLYLAVPLVGVGVGAAGFVATVGWLLARAHTRHVLLKWGEVATVTNVEPLSRGTYYSGTTVQNVRISQARGWQVTRRLYSGPVTKTRIDYLLHGGRGSLILRGLDYAGGVILADSRRPERAKCVSWFPYDLQPDLSGNWPGVVAARTKVGALVMTDLVVGWAIAMIWIWGFVAR